MTNEQENAIIPLLRVLYNRRKFIILMTILAAIISVIMALILPNYYKSSAVIFALNTDIIKPEKMFGLSQGDMYYLGKDEHADRIISIAKSEPMYRFIIDSFNLMAYYDIDPSSSKAYFYTMGALKSDFSIMRNEQEAIVLSMSHLEPQKAQAIVNTALAYLEKHGRIINSQAQEKIAKSLEIGIKDKKQKLSSIVDSMSSVRKKYGVIEPEFQSEFLSELITKTESNLEFQKAKLQSLQRSNFNRDTIALVKAKVAGLENQYRAISSKTGGGFTNINNYNIGRDKYAVISTQFFSLKKDIANDEQRLNYYQQAMEAGMPIFSVIQAANLPEEKFKPYRTMIVAVSVLATFLFSVIIVLLERSIKQIPWDKLRG